MKMPPMLVLTVLVSACSVPAAVESVSSQEVQAERQSVDIELENTLVLSAVDAVRLRQNSGVTLQWIGWDDRGPAAVTVGEGGTYRLSAQQTGADGGRLSVDGIITEIGDGYFVLDGAIAISDTPDAGRNCFDDRMWRFEVTQGRKYYRMRTFEWCDGLTDYIDIYF